MWVILIAGLIWATAFLTHYEQRMQEYNKYQCAVAGYQADCKTPLTKDERLK